MDEGKIGRLFLCKTNHDRGNTAWMAICSFHFEDGVLITSDKNVEGTKLKGEIHTKLRDLIRPSVAAELDDIVQLTICEEHYRWEVVANDFRYETTKCSFL